MNKGVKIESEDSETMESKIESLSATVAAMGVKIDGVIEASKNHENISDLQAQLGSQLKQIMGLEEVIFNRTAVFRAVKILATNYDILRVFSAMPADFKRIFLLDIAENGI
ncbi:hypothetical protein G4B88_026578 [Cannabis sativa]|uniref:Uncharacterized protein n=1 Tax=Cannabis sativa TaxID=3483 RepID=A0A7J6GQU0_CANSA|nr:hypothetical protein G4B88_026578 [Cannabis sativa]